MTHTRWFLLSIAVAAWTAVAASASDTLEQYAQKCDQAIGVTVPDFDCDQGTEVPITNAHSQNGVLKSCDRPNRLKGVCDPGSRFRVLHNSADAFVVAHCRKQGRGPGRYGDIAVIQYNKKNGSTCFYQALGDLDGQVKAPSKGQTAWSWETPAQTAAIGCGGCHDNGPLIRSPYLAQVTGPNKLPGAGVTTFNSTEPYRFIGSDFASWKAYKVEVAGNACNGCHRLGVNNVAEQGTALDFALRATGPDGTEPSKNPHSEASPIWMDPYAITYDQENADAAAAIRNCAQRYKENPLPNSAICKITQFTGTSIPSIPGTYTAVWTQGTQPEIQVYGWTYSDYREKYDQLWKQGWRLYSLQPYVLNGNVRYNAVWRQSTEGEIQVYGWSYADYRAKYDQLWPQGWRLKILQPYVLNGQVFYTAVWRPSTQGEIQVYGWSYADYRAKYDQLWGQGWRLDMLKPYVVNGNVLYTAVWRPSTEGEIQVYGWSYADYRAKYDQLWKQGWRLKLLEPYVVNGKVYYTAAWRPGTYGEFQVYNWSYPDYRARYDDLWEQGWRLSILRTY
jgi:Bacterial tandem repeat domain 1